MLFVPGHLQGGFLQGSEVCFGPDLATRRQNCSRSSESSAFFPVTSRACSSGLCPSCHPPPLLPCSHQAGLSVLGHHSVLVCPGLRAGSVSCLGCPSLRASRGRLPVILRASAPVPARTAFSQEDCSALCWAWVPRGRGWACCWPWHRAQGRERPGRCVWDGGANSAPLHTVSLNEHV